MHVEEVYSHRKDPFPVPCLHNKEYMNSINSLAETLDNIIVEIVRKTRTEKSTD
jgi:hypothetical protein